MERTDFIIAKQKQDAEQAKVEKKPLFAKEKAEAERNTIEVENKVKAEQSAALDSKIADKQKKRDEIRKKTVDGILDSVGSLVGIGKTATLEEEHCSHKNLIALKRCSNQLPTKGWRSRQEYGFLKRRMPKRNVIMPLHKVALLPRNETGRLANLTAKTRMYSYASIMLSDLPMRRKTSLSTDCKVN